MTFKSYIEKIRSFAAAHSQIVAIYIFGSVAAGRERSTSDIDLAIMVRSPMGGLERVAWETVLSNLLRRDVDLIIFGQAGCLLQHQILKYGRLIYEADSRERVRQETKARREYLDTRHLYKLIEV